MDNNRIDCSQVIAAARPGDVLIAVADSVGIHIPRGCMTGLCGACTCDMEDSAFPGNRGILRACSTLVSRPPPGNFIFDFPTA
jgi:ferredoxin